VPRFERGAEGAARWPGGLRATRTPSGGPRKGERVTDNGNNQDPEQGTVATGGNGAAADDGAAGVAEMDLDPTTLKAERDALLEQVVRARADYANLKRRSEQEATQAQRRASERILGDLLPVLDDLHAGLEHVPADQAGSGLANGMKLVEQKFVAALARLGVTEVTALGQPFDPALHEAVDFDAAGGDKVAAVYRRGYAMGDALLRPALVKVGPAPEPAASEAANTEAAAFQD